MPKSKVRRKRKPSGNKPLSRKRKRTPVMSPATVDKKEEREEREKKSKDKVKITPETRLSKELEITHEVSAPPTKEEIEATQLGDLYNASFKEIGDYGDLLKKKKEFRKLVDDSIASTIDKWEEMSDATRSRFEKEQSLLVRTYEDIIKQIKALENRWEKGMPRVLKPTERLFIKKLDDYRRENHAAFYGYRRTEEMPSRAIVLIATHGGYDVDDEFNPLDSFDAPIKIYLYRNAQPSCVALADDHDKYRTFTELQSVSNDFTRETMFEKMNEMMCHYNYPLDRYKENYEAFCFKKVNVRVYQKNDKVANKSFSFDTKKELGCVKVVTPDSFFSDSNLLLPIERGENQYTLMDVVEQAKMTGMTEVHICDMSCSVFIHKGVEIDGDVAHITRWEKGNLGGARKRLSTK